MKKLMKKKNNKGFSLVELIVVVLILGILAVALAPQVMKWVDTAKKNSDKTNAKSIESSVNTAVAEAQSKGWSVPTTGLTFTIDASGLGGTDYATGGTHATLGACVKEVLKLDGASPAYPKTQAGGSYTVTITANYNVSVSYPNMPTE